MGAPGELAAHIVSFFLVDRLDGNFKCIGCSSSRGDFDLDAVLNSNDSEWWISDSPNFSFGKGREWLEFDVSHQSTGAPRRVNALGIKIPVLPYGPLSVRQFHIEHCSGHEFTKNADTKFAVLEERMRALSRQWISNPAHKFTTLDVKEMQIFALVPPIDASRIRIVCTTSAIGDQGEHYPRQQLELMGNCVGLFQCNFW